MFRVFSALNTQDLRDESCPLICGPQKREKGRVPAAVQWVKNLTLTPCPGWGRCGGPGLNPRQHSGLKGPALPQRHMYVGSCSSDSALDLGTSICCGWGHKKKKKKKRKEQTIIDRN